MTNFTITLNEDSEHHFKIAIKAFDPYCLIIYNVKDNTYSIETKLSIEDLKSLTSVKNVVDNIQYMYLYESGYGYSGYDSMHYLKYADM